MSKLLFTACLAVSLLVVSTAEAGLGCARSGRGVLGVRGRVAARAAARQEARAAARLNRAGCSYLFLKSN